jgi:hypothetical protein
MQSMTFFCNNPASPVSASFVKTATKVRIWFPKSKPAQFGCPLCLRNDLIKDLVTDDGVE